jgi:hypothetical protein
MHYLQTKSTDIKTANDFFQTYADYISNNEPINVYSSTSWGICQQMMGKLNSVDLLYIQYRGGSWYCNLNMDDFKSDNSEISGKFITFREVANWLVTNFPNNV